MAASFGARADTGRQFARLDADLKSAGKALRRDLPRGVRRAAEIAADGVRAKAAWSSRIPGAVRVRSRFSTRGASVAVEVDAKTAPEAAPLNNRGRPGTFNVPLFGNRDHVYAHTARPFFEPGIASRRAAADKAIDDVVTTAQKRAGFK